MEIEGIRLRCLSEEDATDQMKLWLSNLYKELMKDSDEANLNLKWLQKVFSLESVFVIVAEEGSGRPVGMLTLIGAAGLRELSGHVEDVVVLEEFRGRKIARALMDEAVRIARREGMQYLALTSRPARVAANEFYKKYGFSLRETNCYKLKL